MNSITSPLSLAELCDRVRAHVENFAGLHAVILDVHAGAGVVRDRNAGLVLVDLARRAIEESDPYDTVALGAYATDDGATLFVGADRVDVR